MTGAFGEMGDAPEETVRDKIARVLRGAADRFRGVDPQTGETDYWGRGGLSGMLGMEPWYSAPPEEIAMGFMGAITPAVKALSSALPEVMPRMASALSGQGRNPDKLVNGYVQQGLISPEMRETAKQAANEIRGIQKERGAYDVARPDMLAFAEQMGRPSSERYARQLSDMKAAKEIEASPISSAWATDRAAKVRSLSRVDPVSADAEARLATAEALTREARRLGWEVRHTSKGNDGRATSRYIKAPDGTEWRISDHRLPYRDDKPNRGWANEIVVDDWRARGLSDYFDEMLRRGAYAEGAP